jgi:UDP-N-acetyl-D-mannosaminuronate dehydrogenase
MKVEIKAGEETKGIDVNQKKIKQIKRDKDKIT